MNTTAGALHLKVSVGAQALYRYPSCSIVIETCLDNIGDT